MPRWLAVTLLASCFLGGTGWTIYARLTPGWGEWYTTSETLDRVFTACPQLLVLYMLLLLCLVRDALQVNNWLALLVVLCVFCSGHAGWPLR